MAYSALEVGALCRTTLNGAGSWSSRHLGGYKSESAEEDEGYGCKMELHNRLDSGVWGGRLLMGVSVVWMRDMTLLRG